MVPTLPGALQKIDISRAVYSTSNPSREVLEKRLADLEATFKDTAPKRPEHWGGILVRPQQIEFWQGRPNRLHDRLRYDLTSGSDWTAERLSP